jgi:RNA polymerase sigma-70 factor (family 1)
LQKDNKTIEAIANGNKKAFSSLYQSYSKKVFNTAISYTKNNEAAEDITQEVFIKIYRSASKFKGESSASTWIYRITVNTCLNYLRKQKTTESESEIKANEIAEFNHPGVLLENKENATILYRAIDCLIENQKTAFILSYIEELPRQEVADIMNTSLKSIESLLQRAKKNMRNELEKIYPERKDLNKKGSKL